MTSLPENPFLPAVRARFRNLKQLGDGALAQVSEAEFFARLDDESNSLATIVKHVAGNQRSRWRDFLTSDGEKPDRHRDREFELEPEGDTRQRLLQAWEAGWAILLRTLDDLTDEDLARTITIRGEPHGVIDAILRQLAHYGYHVGQIVQLAKHWRGPSWKTLSVARGETAAFNEQMARTFGEFEGGA
jgi:hypothetical protein